MARRNEKVGKNSWFIPNPRDGNMKRSSSTERNAPIDTINESDRTEEAITSSSLPSSLPSSSAFD